MARKNLPKTPLLAILRHLDAAQRDEFSALAGTSKSYLYQLAICSRRSCRTDLAKRIADASVLMHKKYGSQVLTMEQVGSMCAVGGE